ncbi:hypothetical protein [Streptomyces sp. NPDC048419]|uniref:hypothetical protein n=1 Tax=Streptomyces sp. NPDC048419 TaxID=3365547 RepID=UPI0037160AE8
MKVPVQHFAASTQGRRLAEGKRRKQAALARQLNVLWALILDVRCCELTPPNALAA